MKIAIVGTVSVGKSSFINSLFGYPVAPAALERKTTMPYIYSYGLNNINYDNRYNEKCELKELKFIPINVQTDFCGAEITEFPGFDDSGDSRDCLNFFLNNMKIYDIIIFISDSERFFVSSAERDIFTKIYQKHIELSAPESFEPSIIQDIIIIANKYDNEDDERDALIKNCSLSVKILKYSSFAALKESDRFNFIDSREFEREIKKIKNINFHIPSRRQELIELITSARARVEQLRQIVGEKWTAAYLNKIINFVPPRVNFLNDNIQFYNGPRQSTLRPRDFLNIVSINNRGPAYSEFFISYYLYTQYNNYIRTAPTLDINKINIQYMNYENKLLFYKVLNKPAFGEFKFKVNFLNSNDIEKYAGEPARNQCENLINITCIEDCINYGNYPEEYYKFIIDLDIMKQIKFSDEVLKIYLKSLNILDFNRKQLYDFFETQDLKSVNIVLFLRKFSEFIDIKKYKRYFAVEAPRTLRFESLIPFYTYEGWEIIEAYHGSPLFAKWSPLFDELNIDIRALLKYCYTKLQEKINIFKF